MANRWSPTPKMITKAQTDTDLSLRNVSKKLTPNI